MLKMSQNFKMLQIFQNVATFNVANVAVLSGCCRVAVPSNVAILQKP